MKLLDIIKEDEGLSDKKIDKLKKIHFALKKGEVIKDNFKFIYVLGDNYKPFINLYGKLGYLYSTKNKPFGIQIYREDIETGEIINLYEKLDNEDKGIIFFNNKWRFNSEWARPYNNIFELIQNKFSKFNLHIWVTAM
jgi:hypothetical protein